MEVRCVSFLVAIVICRHERMPPLVFTPHMCAGVSQRKS
jgi:hypothetical protein